MAKKKVKISSLKRTADQYFSLYIRQKDADGDYNTCCTCGQMFPWKDMDAGHFVHRGRNTLRYDERNCHPQCRICNRGGNKTIAYTAFMARTYDEDTLEELDKLEYQNHQWREWELRDIIEKYKELVKQL
jgi:NAD-dependent dihydropyrimidine dehydrogenase PreA subunit